MQEAEEVGSWKKLKKWDHEGSSSRVSWKKLKKWGCR
jgi:hypothetical protein